MDAISVLFDAYLEGRFDSSPLDAARIDLSGEMDKKLEAGELSPDNLTEYEEAVLRSGFYAGYKAARALLVNA